MIATSTASDANGIREASVDELLAFLTEDERAQVDRDLARLAPVKRGPPVPRDWRRRIPLVFPRACTAPFAERHVQFWDWIDAIDEDSAPRPFTAFWPRGGGKSSSVELGVSDLGCRGKRKYALYVRMTQEKADDSVQNIAMRLESDEVAKYYPEHARRKVGKFGNAKGWRRNRVWTAGGFAVDALGLDTAARGVKLEDQRPDLIVFDDIDALTDGPAQTKKKIETITKSIIPAGANNVALLFVQNLIIRDGIASQLADGRADFMGGRIVSGPFPAVEGLKWTWHLDEETGTRRPKITAGRATWAGQPLATCERNMEQWGPSAFVKEAQHDVKGRGEGVCLRFVADAAPKGHYVDLDDEQTIAVVQRSRCFAGIDPQWWRFGFTLWAANAKGVVVRVAELFSQKETLAVRARKIHELCESVGLKEPSVKTCPIWADAANPQDIQELNLAFREGWTNDDGEHVTSKLRVVKVANENRLRKVAVQRINNMLDKRAVLFRRSVGEGHTWLLGANASSEGVKTEGSRLIWEIENWSVAVPVEGQAQDEDPDDDTADGADMIASMRYALMSHWRPAPAAPETETVEDDRAWKYDTRQRKFIEPPHAVDLFTTQTRRLPGVRGLRPKVRR